MLDFLVAGILGTGIYLGFKAKTKLDNIGSKIDSFIDQINKDMEKYDANRDKGKTSK